jgi:hypothetical protein
MSLLSTSPRATRLSHQSFCSRWVFFKPAVLYNVSMAGSNRWVSVSHVSHFLESGLQLIALRSRELSVPPLPAIALEPFAIVYCLIGLCVSSYSFRKNLPQFVIVISRNS